ncbi:Na+/H+ antiporter NhaA [Delftia sp. PS-11]|uniref:Na+/H+ antiporter NhaA n=1 Tax=Delftia sp. PS-11 TaxID=2767222 RepID=UPI0024590297|nr:Na+/H+ antiporter NhaA [Delftia sp. PS-11]KAJ8746207.1 Na+/H+ antiporter NhaA [Delftia sp. PS-11]
MNHPTTTRPSSPRAPLLLSFADRIGALLYRWSHAEAAGGIVLLAAAAMALAWANSAWAPAYEALWHAPLVVGLGPWQLSQSLHFWVNDALMSVFFLVVGMEIRREMHSGALAQPRQALLPVIAALGGVAAPALIYLAFNTAPPLRNGWAVPTATDIAFAMGVLALLGRGLPPALRVFLLALAIIDDLMAVLIIALFYSGGLQWGQLLVAAGGLAGVFVLQSLGVRRAWAYVLPGAVLWWGIWQAGAHPTLAGVLLGLVTPVHALAGREPAAPVERVQADLHPWVAFGVMPLFALANAGVPLQGADGSGGDLAASSAVMWGVALALVLGKPLGVLASCWLAVRLRLCALPPGMGWRETLLAGLLAGIGFTMAIFIATLAFDNAALLNAAKLGVLMASAAAAVLGLAWGVALRRRAQGR